LKTSSRTALWSFAPAKRGTHFMRFWRRRRRKKSERKTSRGKRSTRLRRRVRPARALLRRRSPSPRRREETEQIPRCARNDKSLRGGIQRSRLSGHLTFCENEMKLTARAES